MSKRTDALNVIRRRKPYIQMGSSPVCSCTNYNDQYFTEVDSPFYDLFLADNILKMQFIIRWNANPNGLHSREFEVIRCCVVRIDGVDPDKQHIDKPQEALSVHPTIVHAMFDKYLSPYGIEMQKVIMYNYKDFACTEFRFTDLDKREALYDYIEETLKKKL